MVATNSTMLPLGSKAPAFRLPDAHGKMVALSDFPDARAVVIVFMCNHCPYVKHLRSGLAQLARDYLPKGVTIVGISSNDAENYPADSPARMAEEAKAAGYLFPYLYDESQAVAKRIARRVPRISISSTTIKCWSIAENLMTAVRAMGFR